MNLALLNNIKYTYYMNEQTLSDNMSSGDYQQERLDKIYQESSETTRSTSNIQCPICNKIFKSNKALSMHLGWKKNIDSKHYDFYQKQVDYIVKKFKTNSIWEIEKDVNVIFKKSQINNICNEYYGKDFVENKSNYNRGWTRGLNKKTDKRLVKLSESISKSLKGRKVTWGDKVSQTRKKLIKEGKITTHNKNKTMENYSPLKKMSNTRKNKILNGEIKFNGGRCNSGFRKDLNKYFRSSFEANFARILKYKSIEYKYETKRYKILLDKNNKTSYLPDFFINDKIYELKGYFDSYSKNKIKKFQEQYNQKIYMIFQNSKLWKWLEKRYSKLIPEWEYYKRYSPNSMAT